MAFFDRAARRRIAKAAGSALLACGVSLGGYLGYLQLSGNFHTVIAGELYRSAQPTPAQLSEYVTKYGVKTVINLRGENEGKAWYDQEIATARQMNVRHIDFRMSASRALTLDEADTLVAILKDAPKPILVHCQAGADRSGLVSVIYSQQVAGLSEATSERQLSILFGHVGIPYLSSTFAMDQSWEHLEDYFGLKQHSASL